MQGGLRSRASPRVAGHMHYVCIAHELQKIAKSRALRDLQAK